MLSFLRSFFRDDYRPPSKRPTTYRLNDDASYYANRDIASKLELTVFLSLDTPLSAVEHFGETFDGPPSQAPDYGENCFWLPSVDWDAVGMEAPDAGTMATEIGQFPTDGGELLPFLKEFRRIVEGRGTAKAKISRIRKLRNITPEYKKLCRQFGTGFPTTWFAKELTVLPGVGEKTALALFDAGLTDSGKARRASVERLVAIPGVGPSLAEKIRASVAD